MLKIQKASAGSGKTYSLTRTYIKLLIGIRTDDGRWRLRNRREMSDAHSHILAVTFTNKATNEMKQRFVEKLADLAAPGDSDADYLDYFIKLFKTTREKIREASAIALKNLLNNYTDFHVGTIDSFFQTILRTFAYESNLRENFRLEIDASFMTRLGLDTALGRIRESSGNSPVTHWTKEIMKSLIAGGSKWNVLQRDGTEKRDIIGFISQIDKDDFRQIRSDLEEYMESNIQFKALMDENLPKAEAKVEGMLDEVKANLDAFEKESRTRVSSDDYSSNFLKQVEKIRNVKTLRDVGTLKDLTRYDGSEETKKGPRVFVKKSGEGKIDVTLLDLLGKVYDGIRRLLVVDRQLKMYSETIPYLGLMIEVLREIALIREDNNIIQLSDTNMMLSKIINEADTPFIYERIGTFFHHYLIDEFQDTSGMQWKNFHPLLAESLSHGYENLIIGDAKQSIYRFRDADSTLITSTVPRVFIHFLPGSQPSLQQLVEENTNHRSSRHIVQFNNTIFSCLLDNPEFGSLGEVYENVVQRPSNMDRPGYVEVSWKEAEAADPEEYRPDKVTDKVVDLLKRGFRQGEIAVLVSSNARGKEVIDGFVEYNRHIKEGETAIEFMSEESLKINRARSVNIIVSALKYIVSGNIDGRPRKSPEGYLSSDADMFNSEINLYSADYPGLSVAEILEKYFEGAPHKKNLGDMMGDMQSSALPALVENIVSMFVPADLRELETPYISAFQDRVIEYCEMYNADPASFLRWWELNGNRCSVSLPESSEAVNVMTIHKSKGLQFRCVIMPEVTFRYSINSSIGGEMKWLPVSEELKDFFPKFVPLRINNQLKSAGYEKELEEQKQMLLADVTNAFYVGITRAVDELYLILDPGDMEKENIYTHLVHETLLRMSAKAGGWPHSESRSWIIDAEELVVDEEECVACYGKPVNPEEFRKEKQESAVTGYIERYEVNSGLSKLKYREAETGIPDEDDDRDPRSAGNVKHDIMSALTVEPFLEDDLRRAVLRARVHGLLSDTLADEIQKSFSSSLRDPRVKEWFAHGLKVYNERPLLHDGKKERRPDRFVVTPEGDAFVIDYKFGDKDKPEYRKQVARYVKALQRTGKFRSVRGWLWYLTLDRVEEVTDRFEKYC